jgi:hypothetical protein
MTSRNLQEAVEAAIEGAHDAALEETIEGELKRLGVPRDKVVIEMIPAADGTIAVVIKTKS